MIKPKPVYRCPEWHGWNRIASLECRAEFDSRMALSKHLFEAHAIVEKCQYRTKTKICKQTATVVYKGQIYCTEHRSRLEYLDAQKNPDTKKARADMIQKQNESLIKLEIKENFF